MAFDTWIGRVQYACTLNSRAAVCPSKTLTYQISRDLPRRLFATLNFAQNNSYQFSRVKMHRCYIIGQSKNILSKILASQ